MHSFQKRIRQHFFYHITKYISFKHTPSAALYCTSCHAHKHTRLRQVTSYWSPNPALLSSPNIVSSSCCLRRYRVLIATPCQRQSRADNPRLLSINLPVPVLIKTAPRSHCLSHLSAPQPGTGRSQCSPNKSNRGTWEFINHKYSR